MVDHNTHNPLLPLRQHQAVILTQKTRKDFSEKPLCESAGKECWAKGISACSN
jgi:hypothetical protein